MYHVRGPILIGLLLTVGRVSAQADGLVAYVPEKAIARTVEDTRISFVEGAVVGKVAAVIPADADGVDILNARGNVKYRYDTGAIDQVDLGALRPGTWTLRVHRDGRSTIRRFMVMERGSVVWSPENAPVRKR